MDQGGQNNDQVQARSASAAGEDGPGSETERFQAITDLRNKAITDLRNNEAVTGESGVPHKQRDHELRRQLNSLDEFS